MALIFDCSFFLGVRAGSLYEIRRTGLPGGEKALGPPRKDGCAVTSMES